MADASSDGMNRREFLARGAVVVGAAAGANVVLNLLTGALGSEPVLAAGRLSTMRWISPRGTLAVMDDYPLHVAVHQGYFRELGLNVDLIAGPTDATATTKFVAGGKADVGYPSPAILATSIGAGMPVIGVFEMFGTQVFDFAIAADSKITHASELRGKTIAVASAGWSAIIDPMLIEVGVAPSSVRYVVAGADWGQAVALHKADAALCWEGLRAQWLAEGLKVKFLLGSHFSHFPSNCYAGRAEDLKVPEKRDLMVRFLKGLVMGLAFGQANPRAAAQITYGLFPTLEQQMKPQLALNSMRELQVGYDASEVAGKGYGWFDLPHWQSYLDVLTKLGQISGHWPAGKVVTNALVAEANRADVKRARHDALQFRLNAKFADTVVGA